MQCCFGVCGRVLVEIARIHHRCTFITANISRDCLAKSKLRVPQSGRLASGDLEGRVVVWDVASGAVMAALDDALTVSALAPVHCFATACQ